MSVAGGGISIYAHLPWCVRKCPYCDFNSHRLRGALPSGPYVAALLSDLETDLERGGESLRARPVTSVFLGGGTPSLLPAEAVAALLEGIARRVALAPDCEITLEANPGASDAARFRGYREAGVNRLSVGVQSFDDRALAAIGRVHDGAAAGAALDAALAAGFTGVNADLMYGLPGQTPAAALADLDAALAAGIGHLSHYQLTLEPGTPFARRPPALPDEETVAAIEAACRRRLAEAGLARYEVSAFARPGQRARHNLAYWRFGDYLGLGAGAHGKLTGREDGALVVERTVRERHPARYLRAAARGATVVRRRRVAAPAELAFEFVLNATRLLAGFTPGELRRATGLAVDALEPALGRALELGLLERSARVVRPTARGLEFLNDLQSLFLPPETAPGSGGRL